MALGSSLREEVSIFESPSPVVGFGNPDRYNDLFYVSFQYRSATRAQLFHRLLSEHKVLIDDHERTRTELRDSSKLSDIILCMQLCTYILLTLLISRVSSSKGEYRVGGLAAEVAAA